MTDDMPENVITLAERRRKPVLGPPALVDIAARLIQGEAPGSPLLVVLEYRGEQVGCLGSFPDTDEGRALAQIVGNTAINTADLLTKFSPSGTP